jgi:hypothetical protein
MSALGQKRTSHLVRVMSRFTPESGIDPSASDVRFVPQADMSMLPTAVEITASLRSRIQEIRDCNPIEDTPGAL